MKRNFLIALITAVMAFAGTSAFAASSSDNSNDIAPDTAQEKLNMTPPRQTYLDMDANKDNKVSQNEFDDYYDQSDQYDNWDANHDGQLSNNEFRDGLYANYDSNDDGYIDNSEWNNGGNWWENNQSNTGQNNNQGDNQ